MIREFLSNPGRLFSLFTSLSLMLIGAIFLLPGNTFDIGFHYQAMKNIAREEYWSILLICIGILKLITLHSKVTIFIHVINIFALWVWLLLTIMMYLVSYLPAVAVIYACISFCEILRLVFLRRI